MRVSLLTLLLFLFYVSGHSQKEAVFSKFNGTVHGIEREDLLQEFSDKMLEYRLLEEVSWDKINFKSRPVSIGLGDLMLEDEYSFGIHLTSTMEILEKSCYEFTLNSDDGSFLWIDGALSIDNRGNHPMQIKRDTMLLDTGTYDIKLWYYQGWPDQCGFIFETKNIRSRTKCIQTPKPKAEQFTLSGEVLFDSGSSVVKQSAQESLDVILETIRSKKFSGIKIYGFTDNIGSADSNLVLSSQRAEAIKAYMSKTNLDSEIVIQAIGMGETEPIANNDTREGRAKNRRVVIEIE